VDNDKEFEKILVELQVKKDIKDKAALITDVSQGE